MKSKTIITVFILWIQLFVASICVGSEITLFDSIFVTIKRAYPIEANVRKICDYSFIFFTKSHISDGVFCVKEYRASLPDLGRSYVLHTGPPLQRPPGYTPMNITHEMAEACSEFKGGGWISSKEAEMNELDSMDSITVILQLQGTYEYIEVPGSSENIEPIWMKWEKQIRIKVDH